MIPIKSVTITTQGAIPLGRQGEHHAREIVFPQPDGLLDEIWTCFHRRARDREAYPVPLEKRDGNLVWLVTSGDTGIPGNGQAELTCVDGSGAVLKTKVYGTSVEKALQDGGEVPDPVKPWYDAILKAIGEVQKGNDGGYYTITIQQAEEGTMTVGYVPSEPDMPAVEPVTVDLPAGPGGEDGGYYSPTIQQVTESTMTVAFQPSQPDMPEQAPVTVNLPVGPRGPRGIAGPTSPYNILDNSDFRNPVNQRGQSSYTGIQYTIDRWRTWSNGNVTVGDGYINKGNESLWQYLPENAIDGSKKYTIALCTTGGTKYVYSGTPSAGFGSWGNTIWFGLETPNWFFRIENGMTENIAWVALYEGEYTAETLPEYHPKGYTVELAECQRYYIAITDNSGPPQGFGFATTSTNVRIMVPLNVQMRMDPTVIFKDGYSVSSIRLFSPNGELNPTEIITISARNSGLHFQLRVSNATVNSVFVMRSMGVECSADL